MYKKSNLSKADVREYIMLDIITIAISFAVVGLSSTNEKLWQLEQSILNKVKVDENILMVQSSSLSHCASKCTAHESCRSFFYHNATKQCVGHNRVPGEEEMVSEVGFKMYRGLLTPGK